MRPSWRLEIGDCGVKLKLPDIRELAAVRKAPLPAWGRRKERVDWWGLGTYLSPESDVVGVTCKEHSWLYSRTK